MSRKDSAPANPIRRSTPVCPPRLDEDNIPFERCVETLVQRLVSGATTASHETVQTA